MTPELVDLNGDAMLHMVLKMAVMRQFLFIISQNRFTFL